MLPDLRESRARELYRRLPEVYRVRDWDAAVERVGDVPVRSGQVLPELEALLSLVADDIGRLRGHIGELWDDFFIETCAEWVVPYLADLLGVQLAFNAAQRNRVDVKNTIEWRRRKGILSMLADLSGDITGWGAGAAEFFENLGWAQHLNHVKRDHFQAPDLRDPFRLSQLDTAADPWLHAVDVRQPRGSVGRYGIKTIGLFLSRLTAYPLRGGTPVTVDLTGERYTFDPLGRDRPLFDSRDRQPIGPLEFARDPYGFFGDPAAFSVRQHGILIATDRPEPAPTEPVALWTGFGPERPGDTTQLGGLRLMEPERFETPMRRFVITVRWGTDFTAAPLGSLESFSGVVTPGVAASGDGSLLLSLELDAGSDIALFPATVLAVRNDRAIPMVSDSRDSRYRDALYVHLPEVLLRPGEHLPLYVGDDGSTLYARRAPPHIGAADVHPQDAFSGTVVDRTLLARAALGQCFPGRRFQYSLEPTGVVDLHRMTGLRLADEGLFVDAPGKHGARGFVIEARLLDGQTRTTRLIGRLATTTVALLPAFQYLPEAPVAAHPGERLVLKIVPATTTDTLFPLTDLIVTDRAGRALLVALPQMEFITFPAPVWLLFDTAGASYYASSDFGHDTALGRPERDGAFHFDPQLPSGGLARRSPGQVLPIPDRVPIQQRVPVYANLCHWDHPKPRPPRPGELAVDPTRGRFLFAPGEGAPIPLGGGARGLQVDFHEGFAGDVGALTYDRYASLAAPDNPQPTRYVSSSGDADRAAPVYGSVAAALLAAVDGDVIQIEDSATYAHTTSLSIPAGVERLVIQAANRQRPCLRFSGGGGVSVDHAMRALRLNGLLISGAPLTIADASEVTLIELVACTFDPTVAGGLAVVATGGTDPTSQISLCRCVAGGLQLGQGVAEVIVADSILDRRGDVAIGGLAGHEARARVHLERTTVWGQGVMHQLYGSECLLVDQFTVTDQQEGCLRYSRFQLGSRLPRRFQCVPSSTGAGVDPVAPVFNSRRFGRAQYGQLHLVCPTRIRQGAEDGAEVGALHLALAALREKNLGVKLDEYLPVGLTPALIYVS